jgi:serine/threonine-protein kinase RsbW
MKVWDEGGGFSQDVLRDPTSPENLFKPNGRGIFLIRQFTDDLEFAKDASGRFGIVMTVSLDDKKSKKE